uniref:Uncharacterized protein n=1 Tax=Lygus hesperus TaxID=30085 RepID=A0A146LHN5_LYGHE
MQDPGTNTKFQKNSGDGAEIEEKQFDNSTPGRDGGVGEDCGFAELWENQLPFEIGRGGRIPKVCDKRTDELSPMDAGTSTHAKNSANQYSTASQESQEKDCKIQQ